MASDNYRDRFHDAGWCLGETCLLTEGTGQARPAAEGKARRDSPEEAPRPAAEVREALRGGTGDLSLEAFDGALIPNHPKSSDGIDAHSVSVVVAVPSLEV